MTINKRQQFYLLLMLNVHMVSKTESKKMAEERARRQHTLWETRYRQSVRPMLLERHGRRVNSFILKLEEDKKELYEYRMKTETNALAMLKDIEYKERFLGDQTIKLRDVADWNSMLPTAQRIEKEKNKVIFEKKFGDANIAYRSIASQSMYYPKGSNVFRERRKDKELHQHSMRFTTKRTSFGENRKAEEKGSKSTVNVSEEKAFVMRRRSTTASLYSGDEEKASEALKSSNVTEEEEVSSVQREERTVYQKQVQSNSSKVYFKQILDLEQNVEENTAKKSLHQILVRFGITRIKDMKKQAMMETDNMGGEQL